jgi:hypothetical protein
VYNGELTPVKLKFVPKREMGTYKRPLFTAVFVKELISVLSEIELNGVIGIQTTNLQEESDVELMEITSSRSSMMVLEENLTIPTFAAS